MTEPSSSILEEATRLAEAEQRAENRIQVPPDLRSPHPIIKRSLLAIRSTRPDPRGLISSTGDGCLRFRVSKNLLDRTARLVSAFFRALENRGHSIEKGERGVAVNVLGVPFEIELEEVFTRSKKNLTPTEEKRIRAKELIRDDHNPLLWDYHLTGRLELRVGIPASRERWRDGKKQRLEELLNELIAHLLLAAGTATSDRLLDDARRAEAHQRRVLKEWQERNEAVLFRFASEWRRANEIREFIDAVRAEAIRRNGEIAPESEISRWLEWAQSCAEEMDPLSTDCPLPSLEMSTPSTASPGATLSAIVRP